MPDWSSFMSGWVAGVAGTLVGLSLERILRVVAVDTRALLRQLRRQRKE